MFSSWRTWFKNLGSRKGQGERPARKNKRKQPRPAARLRLEDLETRVVPAGTWTHFNHLPPTGTGTMMLLSDGSFMAQGAQHNGTDNAWYRLTPGSDGSYATNGTWSALPSMSLQRQYFASNVLPDGRVLVVGGEYSGPFGTLNDTNTGEIFDPTANGGAGAWHNIAPFPQSHFGDDPSMVLGNGQVLCGYLAGPQTYLYNPATNTWTQTGTKLHNDQSDEETWLKLPDGSVLTYDIWDDVTTGHSTAQRYLPSTGQWVDAGTVPVHLSSTALGDELGGATLLPDGRAWFIGCNGNTAFYTPSTNSWATGPTLPNGQHADDAPLCMMTNGHVLMALDGPGNTFSPPTRLWDYDPVGNSFTQVNPPPLAGNNNVSAFTCRMLALPNGRVAFEYGRTNDLYVYTPGSGPNAAWAPTVSAISATSSTFTLTGTQLNGISAGASYGDDAEMDSNFPIVEYLDHNGSYHYARTFNWSSTGVQTGSTPVTTQYTLPAGVTDGAYRVQVVTNGIASSAVLNVLMDSALNNVTLKIDGGNPTLYDVFSGNILLSQWSIGSFSAVDVTMKGTPGTVNILSTPPGVPVNVYAAGHSTINIGNAGSLAGIQGPVALENIPSFSTVNIDDHLDPNPHPFVTLSTQASSPYDSGASHEAYGRLSGLAPAPISWEYNDTSGVTINGAGGGTTFTVIDVPQVATTLNGTGGANALRGPNLPNAWTLSAAQGGNLDGKIIFNNIQNLVGGTGGDTFILTSPVPVSSKIVLNSASKLTAPAGTYTLSGTVSNNGNLLLVGGPGNITLTPTAVVSGAGGLTVQGPGTLTLWANNSYSGPTTVLGGTLVVNGFQTNSPITVNAGGTLAGIGSVGPLLVKGGTVAPGPVGGGTGTLTATAANFSMGGRLVIQAFPNGTFDRLNVTGPLILGGTSTLTVNANGLSTPRNFPGIVHFGLRLGNFSTVNKLNTILTPTLITLVNSLDVDFS
jgi:autotransporter-associated beta strand protein